ncbi:unnamed protein product [Calypogeia fissa]
MSKPDALADGVHKFTADGITFSYIVTGTGPLLVVQSVGWGPSSSYLRNGLKDLKSEFKLLFFEPRGNGESTRPDSASAMGTKDMAYDLEHLREHLQLPSFALLGHSNGGAIALAYAERFPSKVTKLILANHELQTFNTSESWSMFVAARKDDPIYGPALEHLMELIMDPPSTDEEFSSGLIKAIPYYFADPSNAHIQVENMDGSLSVWTYLAQSKKDKADPFPHVAELENVTAKTLILSGREDAVCSVAAMERTRDGIKGSRLVVWEDCGHVPWIEKKEEFFEEVTKFLKAN